MKNFFKGVISLTAVISALLSFSVYAFALSPGDIDGNSRVSAADARLTLRAAANLEKLTPEQFSAADMNKDSKITASDARTVLRIAASLESPENYTDTGHPGNENKQVLSPSEVYEEALNYTVEINTYNENGTETSVSSGFFTDYSGTFVTNYHAVKDAYSVKIKTGDGGIYNAEYILGWSEEKDIAVLKVDIGFSVPAVLSDEKAKTAEEIYVMGSTVGMTGTFTNGIVSTAERQLEEMNNNVKYIQITAPISNGNSGGPVINCYGEVIGIAAMCHNSAQNLNYAIPVYEIDTIDLSSPMTVKEFHDYISNRDEGSEFSGLLALSVQGVSLEKGGTAVFYAFASATQEYNIVCEASSENVKAYAGRNYGNFTVIYVSALKDYGSAQVKVYFDGYEQYAKTMTVSIGGSVTENYVGIPGGIPDFGALTGTAPCGYIEGTDNSGGYYSFYYSFEDLNAQGVSSQKAINEYISLMKENGFSYAQTSDNSTAVSFINNTSKTAVFLGFTEINNEYFMYVLIYQ